MRVLHVYRTYYPDPPGGLQEAIRQICFSVRGFGVENTVFTLSPDCVPAELQHPETRVVRCRSWAAPASCDLGGLRAFHRFRELARGVDVVHYHFPWPFADALDVVGRSDVPAVMTYHSDIVRQRLLGRIYRPLMMRTLRSMSAVVATSPAYARTSHILSSAGVRNLVRAIPLGIDRDSYPQEGDGRIFAKLGIDPGEPFFLFIGVLRYYKGLQYLLQAVAKGGGRLVIAGGGPEAESVGRLIDELGAQSVILAGHVSARDKVALLQRCRGLVLPSHLRSEAFGMVLVEAAMYGKPMISCEIGTGTSFVNVDGETGFVVEAGNPRALADAMRRLLTDEGLACRMGQAARERYEALFSGEALGRAYSALYHEVAR